MQKESSKLQNVALHHCLTLIAPSHVSSVFQKHDSVNRTYEFSVDILSFEPALGTHTNDGKSSARLWK